PLLVTAHARAVIQGLHAEGVLTALKHFPGHGSSNGASHTGFVDVTDTADRCPELTPYRTLIAERLSDGIMTAHVFNRALDPEFPATLSRATITGLLRDELGFGGPVVTDDLRMRAIERHWGLEAAAVRALAAGADILLIADDRLPDGGSGGPHQDSDVAPERATRPRGRRSRARARPRAQGAARRRLSRERPRRPSGSSRTEQRFDLVPTGQRRLGAAPCARERRSRAGESQRIRERARLAQRHGEARVERVSRGGRVHDRHWQRGDADLAVGRAGQRALGAERHDDR